ncbi:MAG: flavin reductase family protein [SAR324 cluster bacterium]|nr:flavin reductase family protein [SAR324 cluster bacterium]
MVEFASTDKPLAERYKLLIGCVVPRPIAFVATKGSGGVANLAPFSFFNGVSANPLTVAFSVGDRGEVMKDTSRNISEHPEFIVHVVSEPIAEQMNITCGDFGAHVDEFTESGLTALPGTVVDVPRVKEALVAMECRMTHHLRIGGQPPVTSHILGEVLYWHIDDSLLNERMHVDADVLQAVGRMGGIEYTRTADRLAIVRPVIASEDERSIPSYQAMLARPLPK